MDFRLTYGDLDLCDHPFALEFGADFGAPQNVTEALAFLLQDGEVELSSRASNRTIVFNVLVMAADMVEAADAEAALTLETEKPRNTLTVDPGDGFGVLTVFDTSRAQVTWLRDDNLEMQNVRRYQVTVKAQPFGRSENETVTAALPATGTTTTLLDACSAATGWTGLIDGGAVTPSAAGGAVSVSGAVSKARHSFTLQKTFGATTTSTKLLVVDWLPPPGGFSNTDSTVGLHLQATGDGVALPLVAEAASPTAGYTRSWFQVDAPALAVTRFDWRGYFPIAATVALTVDNVSVSDVSPIVGNARQQPRSLTVGGSAPAPGTLVLASSSSAALGNGTMVYVYAADDTTAGYTPAMRQFRTSGNTVTTSASMVSGASEPLDGGSGVTFDVPIGLFPAGTYLLMARLMTSGGGTPTITYTTSTTFSGNTVSNFDVGTRALTITATYTNYVLAKLTLPNIEIDRRTAGLTNARLTLTASSACSYDEIWLFNRDIGALIQVDCGTGTSLPGTANQRVLAIQSPTVTMPRPTVRIGHNSDLSDGRHAISAQSWDFPRFEPSQVNVFTVTPASTTAGLELRYFKHWHTNAAE